MILIRELTLGDCWNTSISVTSGKHLTEFIVEYLSHSLHREQEVIDKYNAQIQARENAALKNKGDYGTTPTLQLFSKQDEYKSQVRILKIAVYC